MTWENAAAIAVTAFLASLVEFVEALTVVLAVGSVRGWRGALTGAGVAAILLAVLIASLGPHLADLPLRPLQFGVGTLLLLFGMRWLRKAILRAGGIIPLHDETALYAFQTAAFGAMDRHPGLWDRVAISTSFKIVMIEGIEVVFIVIAVSAGGSALLMPAAAGAAAAGVLVVLLGFALHRPIARLPENALKFMVGLFLTAFGTLWVGEGMGVDWPGGDAAPVLISGIYLLVALACVRLIRSSARTAI